MGYVGCAAKFILNSLDKIYRYRCFRGNAGDGAIEILVQHQVSHHQNLTPARFIFRNL